jgi:hypothetical protein
MARTPSERIDGSAVSIEREDINDGIETVNPGDFGAGAGDSGGNDTGSGSDTGPKRRGRKPGIGNTKKAASVDINRLEGILLSIHMMGAGFLKCPELILDDKEAKNLSEAIVKVQSYYPNTIFNQKYMDIGALIFVLIGVYGTRIVAINERLKSEREKAKSDNAVNVTNFPIGGFNAS